MRLHHTHGHHREYWRVKKILAKFLHENLPMHAMRSDHISLPVAVEQLMINLFDCICKHHSKGM